MANTQMENITGIRRKNDVPSVIIFSGPDGAGKTALARLLVKTLGDKGITASYVWLRYSHFFSLPVLAYGRLSGMTKSVQIGEREHRIWEFCRSRLVSTIFPWTAWLDMFTGGFFKLRLPAARGRTIVCDRYACDSLVDLVMATGNERLPEQRVGKLMLSSTPSDAHTFVILANPDIIIERRPEMAQDAGLERKCRLYRSIAPLAGATLIENNGSVDAAFARISRALGI